MAAPKESILGDRSQNPQYTVVDSPPTEGYEQGGRKEDADSGDRRFRFTFQQGCDEDRRRDLRHLSDGDLVQ